MPYHGHTYRGHTYRGDTCKARRRPSALSIARGSRLSGSCAPSTAAFCSSPGYVYLSEIRF